MRNKILILVDYIDNFWISIRDFKNYKSMDVKKIENMFIEYGFEVSVLRFENLDFKLEYRDYIILYQSSEDLTLNYKSYIEDIILWMKNQQALIIPEFIYLRSHHNKNMMELLKNNLRDESFKTIKTEFISTYEMLEYKDYCYPVVVKTASGAGSNGVFLAYNKEQLIKKCKKLTLMQNKQRRFYQLVKLKRKIFNQKIEKSTNDYNNNKFIVQSFINNLSGDYKVLVFSEKYYILHRQNRKNDFRASGSGIFIEPVRSEVNGLLDFSKKLYLELDVPMLAIDVGFDGERYHLIEFQCIHFGPYTLQASEYYYSFDNEKWVKIYGKSDLEYEFVNSIISYISKSKRSDV